MSRLDEILDWYTRPVNRVEFLDTRKRAVKELMLELIGEDGDVPEGENLSWTEMRYQAAQQGINSEREALRQKVNEL